MLQPTRNVGVEKTLPVAESPERVSTQTPSFSVDNWYKHNSVNLLLYVGAFLIVASASIFVGFQWESISGVMKGSLLTVCCLGFFGFGAYFYRIPKIRSAGLTFIGIGALLIPIVGSGWYEFVFKTPTSIPGGIWLITSLIALVTYLVLALKLKNNFYSYLSTVGTLSLILSFMNISQLDATFYVLGGIITSYVLLISTAALKNTNEHELQDRLTLPFHTAADVMLPLSLSLGLLLGIMDDKLATAEATASVLLGSVYYIISYLQKPALWKIVASEGLFAVAVILCGLWLELELQFIFYILVALGYGFILLFGQFKAMGEQQATLRAGLVLLVCTALLSMVMLTGEGHVTFITLLVASAGFLAAYLTKNIRYVTFFSVFSVISLYYLASDILQLDNEQLFLAFAYVAIGVLFYIAGVYYRKYESVVTTTTLSVGLFFILSLLYSLESSANTFWVSAIITLVAYSSVYFHKRKKLVYLANIVCAFAIYSALRWLEVDTAYYPLFFSIFSFILYGLGLFLPTGIALEFRNSGIAASIITPAFFGTYATGLTTESNMLQQNALISSYASTILIATDYILHKTPGMGYLLGVLGMLTLLWQLHYLEIEEYLAYTLPLGAYFLGLGYVRGKKGKVDDKMLLDIIGFAFLIAPTFMQSLSDDGGTYSIILFITGVALIAIGISFSYRYYKQVGLGALVLAVLTQTYDYLFSLPRWVVVGIAGTIFITIAILILLRRKDE